MIPKGALSETETITITKTSDPAPAGYVAYSPIYRFDPSGLTFAKPATVTIVFSGNPSSPAVFWSKSSGSGYDALTSAVGGNSISAAITHFSFGFVGVALASSDGGNPTGAGGSTAIDASSDAEPSSGGSGGSGATASGGGSSGSSSSPVDASRDSNVSAPSSADASMDAGPILTGVTCHTVDPRPLDNGTDCNNPPLQYDETNVEVLIDCSESSLQIVSQTLASISDGILLKPSQPTSTGDGTYTLYSDFTLEVIVVDGVATVSGSAERDIPGNSDCSLSVSCAGTVRPMLSECNAF